MPRTLPPAHRVHLLEAGSTKQLGAIARRGGPWRPVRFPALVAVIEHPGGVVVVDTGYSARAVAGLRHGLSRIYGALLPASVSPRETISVQLDRLGLGPVTDVVLTHLHLDHVGGLADLLELCEWDQGTRPRVVVDRESVVTFRRACNVRRLVRGWVPGTIPETVDNDVTDPAELPWAREPWARLAPLPTGRDLLGDGSIVLVPLDGHAGGHLGVLVRALGVNGAGVDGGRADSAGVDLLLLGDAAWDVRAVTERALPAVPVRLISHDWPSYVRTLARLRSVLRRRPDLQLLPSHDEAAIARIRDLLA
ncbi:MBL fold metallo-hydrolase [Salana multivorans]